MSASSDTAASPLLFRALADDTRLRILRHLAAGECCVCDLTAELGVAQSLLSFHLRVLKESGLIRDRREGRWAYYALDTAAVRSAGESLLALVRPPAPRRRGRRCE